MHSLRAYAFFKEEIEELLGPLDPTDPASINRIKDEAKDYRQLAKPISFGKQYGAGPSKIQQLLKCSTQRARDVSDSYDDLYRVTKAFNERNNEKARQLGYAECAFGLRLYTPRINALDNATRSAEERSSNNAVTQSWGMLTNRAVIEFDKRVDDAGMYNDVKLINTIHDAIYLLIRKDAKVIKWVNDNLIECMMWQEHPTLESDVRMAAELDIGPSWKDQKTLKNNMTEEQISEILAGF